MMETSNGSAGSDTRPSQPEKKRPNRVPSPARPFLKDVHARAAKPPAIGPKSPKLAKQQATNRGSRRNITAAKEKPAAAARSSAKAGLAKKPSRLPGAEFKATGSPILAKAKKGNLVPACPGHGSPVRVPSGLVGQTDSSSDLSDCPSELAPVASSDAESGTGSSDKDHPGAEHPLRSEPPATATATATATTLVLHPAAKATACAVRTGPEKKPKGPEEELLREIEDLRSENDYLKVSERDSLCLI